MHLRSLSWVWEPQVTMYVTKTILSESDVIGVAMMVNL